MEICCVLSPGDRERACCRERVYLAQRFGGIACLAAPDMNEQAGQEKPGQIFSTFISEALYLRCTPETDSSQFIDGTFSVYG